MVWIALLIVAGLRRAQNALVKMFSHGTAGILPSTFSGMSALIWAFSSAVTLGCRAGVSRAALYQTTAITRPMAAEA